MTMDNTAFAEVVSADTVRIERRLEAPVADVWRYLVDPEKRAKWFAAGEIDPQPGGRLICVFDHNSFSPEPGEVPEAYKSAIGHRSELKIIAIEPPRLLSHDWGDGSVVSFELAPDGDGTRLVLTHSRLKDRAAMKDVTGGWTSHLTVLGDVVAGRTLPNFWGIHADCEAKVADLLG